jgi:hypothetical protein
MVAKKPEGIPLSEEVRYDRALPEHRRKLHRKERESVMSTDGSTSLADAIEDEYLHLTDADKQRRDTYRKNATNPRGRKDSDTERTTRELVIDVLKGLPADATPDDLLPHVHAAIEADGRPAITDKWAKELVRRARKSN